MSLSDVAFPALTARLFEGYESRRGSALGALLSDQLVAAIDHALVHSRASTEYLEALLAETAGSASSAILILSLARYGYRHGVSPEYIATVFRLPFRVDGQDEHVKAENRVRCLHEAGVPAEYAVALRNTGLTASEVGNFWQEGLSAEYVAAGV